MSVKTKQFVILWAAGFIGVVSFLLVDLSALVANLPLPAEAEIPPITTELKLLSLIQPTVILTAAVLGGGLLAPAVGLSAPVVEAVAAGRNSISVIRSQILPSLIGGFVGGLALIVTERFFAPWLPPEVVVRIAGLDNLFPLTTRLLYGGITEELLIRWGLMTLLVQIMRKLFRNNREPPPALYFVTAILLSAVIFGIGHLPIVFLLFPETSPILIIYIVFANSLFGLIAGFLYWKRGLESAVFAHMCIHVLIFAASYFGSWCLKQA